MKHGDIIESTCSGKVKSAGSSYAGDVFWEIYLCDKCKKKIYAVDGRKHRWNYEK